VDSLPECFFFKQNQSCDFRLELCCALANFYPPEASPKLHRLAIEIVQTASEAERKKIMFGNASNLDFIQATAKAAAPFLNVHEKSGLVAIALVSIKHDGKILSVRATTELFELLLQAEIVTADSLASEFVTGM
jgi:hypothetical protein